MDITIVNKNNIELDQCGCLTCDDFILSFNGKDGNTVSVGKITKKQLLKLRSDIENNIS